MKSPELKHLMEMIVQCLNQMDERLTGHGERVAYGMLTLLDADGSFSSEEKAKIIWTMLLHDIGSFHNPDIKDLLKKETDTAFSHSRYGYLFLNYLGPFPEYAGVVLYHHSGRKEADRSDMPKRLKRLSKCLQVLDAVDLKQVGNPSVTLEQMENFLNAMNTERYEEDSIRAVKEMLPKLMRVLKSQEEIHQVLLGHLEQMRISQDIQEQLLRMLVSSIDFRSHYTALHCAVMVRVSDLLAQLCGLEEKERRQVHLGAILHDLGKIAIPSEILESPGKLEGKDWEIMKSHVSITEKILKGHVEEEVLQIAVRHHETLNGQGYPYGIGEQGLSLPQRIAAVADIASALSEERSYKPAFPLEEVLEILENLAENGRICPYVFGVLKKNKDMVYEEALKAGMEARAMYETIYTEYEKGQAWKKKFLEIPERRLVF